ncbi:MAG: hypothetical protein HY273_04275 [Gammaproteobacteria bacterium]|nr:hypothetical protein [Gammaproteobacteria bacterium]
MKLDVITVGMAARLLTTTPARIRAAERIACLEPARTLSSIRIYSPDDLPLLEDALAKIPTRRRNKGA